MPIPAAFAQIFDTAKRRGLDPRPSFWFRLLSVP
jgi:hypothetical protein